VSLFVVTPDLCSGKRGCFGVFRMLRSGTVFAR